MTKILVMTDIHITAPNKLIAGLNSLERFQQGLNHAAQNHPDAERLIIMGDLTHTGSDEEYIRLRAAMSEVPWPVSFMVGNHDDRDTFKRHFPDTETDASGFVQSVIDFDDVQLILLDSLDENLPVKHGGHLCKERLAFLQQALDSAQTPCLVFVHHTPFETGFTGMDAINLQNAAELRALLKDSPATRLFAGHIHRNITATLDGIAMTTFKSTCHQMPMLLGADGSAHSVDEPGAYGIILANGPDVVVHFEDFTLVGPTISQDSDSV